MGRRPPRELRRGAKVGRNDPCPCGSGEKAKRCTCGRREAAVSVSSLPGSGGLLFVFPGQMGDALFALPTLLAAATQAKAHGIERVTWLLRPYTAPVAPVIDAGLAPLRGRLRFEVLDGDPGIPPSRASRRPEDPAAPMARDWGDWSAEDWLREFPEHDACVNASMREAPRGERHLTRHIALSAGLDAWPWQVQLERRAVAGLWPDAPEGAVVFQPTCSEPEKTPMDLVYARLPAGTIVVRAPGDPGLPRELIRRYGYEEWVGEPLERVAATVAKARLVVGVASLLPALAAHLLMPAVMVHRITTPEQCGITPWGGIDACNPKDQGSLEELFERLLHDDYVRREDGRVPLLR